MSLEPLPEFERPPVVETILGVQFDSIEGFANAHLGAFWATISGEWPEVSDKSPLPPQFERFDGNDRLLAEGFQFQLAENFQLRLLARNAARDRLLQIQNGQLRLNWVGSDSDAGVSYPRYANVRQEFDSVLSRFRDFLSSKQLDNWRPNQWEITYINHIPSNTVWRTPEDWPELFSQGGVPAPVLGSASLESLGAEWHYVIGQKQGRLHVNLKHGRKKSTARDQMMELLVLTLTARGPLDPKAPDLDNGLNLGHDVIVRAFAQLTAPSAHEFWGKINVS